MFNACKDEDLFEPETKANISENVSYKTSENCSGASIEKSGLVNSNCFPGEYNIENGVLKFLNREEFLQTLDFLECADGATVKNWRYNIPIITALEVYENFMGNFCSSDSLSNETLDSLILEYDGEVNIEWSSENEIEVTPKYYSYSIFRNMDGYFMIGDQIEAEVGNTRISVFNGDWQNLNQLTSNSGFSQDTTLYQGDSTLVVYPRWPDFGDICCDNFNEGQQIYNFNEDKKRHRIRYTWADISLHEKTNAGYFVTPILKFEIRAWLWRENRWGNWRNHDRHWKVDVTVKWSVVPTSAIETDNLCCTIFRVDNPGVPLWWWQVLPIERRWRSPRIGPYEEMADRVVCPFEISYESEVWAGDFTEMENSQTIECSGNILPPSCKTCPDGWPYSEFHRACRGDCIPNSFVWNNIMYYHYVGGIPGNCPYGGFDNGASCDLGFFPIGWKDNGYEDDDCFFIKPRCE